MARAIQRVMGHPTNFVIPRAPVTTVTRAVSHIPWPRWEQASNNSFKRGLSSTFRFLILHFSISTEPRIFPMLFLVILAGKKNQVNQGFWHVSFSWREHKVELPASLIKHRIYGRPFIYIQLKCSLLGDWECMEIIIWKGLTLRTEYRGSNVASPPLPFHRTPVHCALHRGDSSRFYKYLPVAL